MKDPVILEREDLLLFAQQIADKTAEVVAGKAVEDLLKIIGLKSKDVNRTVNASEALRMCHNANVKVGRKRLMDMVPWQKRNMSKVNSRIEFKEKDIIKFLNK